VLYLRLIILSVGGDISVDSEALLVTDFVNLKIKSAQSFEGAHRRRVWVHVFIGVFARTCISISICIVFLKKIQGKFHVCHHLIKPGFTLMSGHDQG
jgi:hypothetical protein